MVFLKIGFRVSWLKSFLFAGNDVDTSSGTVSGGDGGSVGDGDGGGDVDFENPPPPPPAESGSDTGDKDSPSAVSYK